MSNIKFAYCNENLFHNEKLDLQECFTKGKSYEITSGSFKSGEIKLKNNFQEYHYISNEIHGNKTGWLKYFSETEIKRKTNQQKFDEVRSFIQREKDIETLRNMLLESIDNNDYTDLHFNYVHDKTVNSI